MSRKPSMASSLTPMQTQPISSLSSAQAYLAAHHHALLRDGFVAVVYSGRPGVCLVKSVPVEHFSFNVLDGTGLDDDEDLYNDRVDFYLTHTDDTVIERPEPDFVVVAISPEGLVTRKLGVEGRADGPVPIHTMIGWRILRSVSATVPRPENEVAGDSGTQGTA